MKNVLHIAPGIFTDPYKASYTIDDLSKILTPQYYPKNYKSVKGC